MPIKIESNLNAPPETNRAVDMSGGHDVSYGVGMLQTGLEQGSKALTTYLDKKNLSNASANIDSAISGAIQAERDVAARDNYLRNQMMSADENVYARASAELAELTQARIQGVIGGQELEIRANNLVKWYSNQYPHLGGEIRALGANANDNMAAAARSMAGKDPESLARDKIIQDAIALGVTPYNLILTNNLEKQKQLAKLTADTATATQTLDGNKLFITMQAEQAPHLTQRQLTVYQDITRWLNSGQEIHNDQVTAQLEIARKQDLNYFRALASKRQTDAGAPLTVAQLDQLEGNINSIYDSMIKEIVGLKTSDNLGRWAKNNYEMLLSVGQERFARAAGGNLQAALAVSSPDAFNAYVNSLQQAKLAYSRMVEVKEGNIPEADRMYYEFFKQDPAAMGSFVAVKNGDADKLIAAGIGNLYNYGGEINTGNPHADREATSMSLDMYDNSGWEDRKNQTENFVKGLPYQTIVQSPRLLTDLKYNDAAQALFADKAMRYISGFMGAPGTREEMELDLSNYNRPIRYRYGAGPGGLKNEEEINRVYKTLSNTLDRGNFDIFLKNLEAHGITRIKDPYQAVPGGVDISQEVKDFAMGRDQPTAATTEAPRDMLEATLTPNTTNTRTPRELVSYAQEAGTQLGIPREYIQAFMKIESDMGQALLGPEIQKGRSKGQRATGGMMIMRGTFDDINAQHYDNKLDFRNQKDKLLASLTRVADIIRTVGINNLDEIAGRYHGGDGWQPNRDDGVMMTKDYIAKFKKYVAQYKAQS